MPNLLPEPLYIIYKGDKMIGAYITQEAYERDMKEAVRNITLYKRLSTGETIPKYRGCKVRMISEEETHLE